MEPNILRTHMNLRKLDIVSTVVTTALYVSQNKNSIQNYITEQLKAIYQQEFVCFVSRQSFSTSDILKYK